MFLIKVYGANRDNIQACICQMRPDLGKLPQSCLPKGTWWEPALECRLMLFGLSLNYTWWDGMQKFVLKVNSIVNYHICDYLGYLKILKHIVSFPISHILDEYKINLSDTLKA